MTVNDKRTQNRRKLQSLLRELFQIDSAADLDFGIYRIMNEKRDEVVRFIEDDLLDAVEEALAQFRTAEREELESQLAQRRTQLGRPAFDNTGEVREPFRELTIAQEFMELRQRLDSLEVAQETEARIFNDLFTFFSRYYDNGDFLTERRYSSKEAKFAVPYNGEEVLLHWANRDQYYVKTTERFTDYRFNAGDYAIWFRLHRADVSQDNIKSAKRYFVLREDTPLAFDEERKTLTIFFEYRPITQGEEAHFLSVYNAQEPKRGRRKTLDRAILCEVLEVELLGALHEPDVKAHLAVVPEDGHFSALGRHLNRYTARNTMDYFVHKDLGGFLRRELDFFVKSEVLRLDDVMADDGRELLDHVLARARVVRQIADRIITFLAQIEDFQKRLFEKRKFVVQTDYSLTLDRVPEEFYQEILDNDDQLEEWQRLYRMGAWDDDLRCTGEFDIGFLQNHPYMMLDTTFFDDDFKARLLSTFDDLGGAIDGVLIHGENFQALNLLLPEYKGQVKCIYIDPPYNTGSDGFVYKDNYQHSSWLTMMEDRLHLGREFLHDSGGYLISIDYNQMPELRAYLERGFGSRTFRNAIVFRRGVKSVQAQFDVVESLTRGYEYVLFYSKSPDSRFKNLFEELDEEKSGSWNNHWRGTDRPTMRYELFGIEPQSGQWRWSEERSKKAIENYDQLLDQFQKQGIYLTQENMDEWYREQLEKSGQSGIDLLRYNEKNETVEHYVPPRTERMLNDVWFDISPYGSRVLQALFGGKVYDNPKPVPLIKRVVRFAANNNDSTLDFFAGSGTTAHAVMDLNREDEGDRKYILVEIGDYFDTVLKPRIQKVAFSASWKDGVPRDRNGMSHMFKYQRLESYEDALNNICVRQPESAQRRLLHGEYGDYMLSYMLDFETRYSSTLLTQEAFEKPFQYTLKIQQGDQSLRDTVVDLVETFHYLIGMHVRRLEQHEQQGRRYVVSRGEVRTEHGLQKVVTIWRDTEDLDLEQEADWANAELLTDPVDRVYVNGPSFIDKAQPLEITFRQRMQGGARGA